MIGHFRVLGRCLIDASPMTGMLFCAAMNAVLLNKGLAEFEAMTPALVWLIPYLPECFSCFGGCRLSMCIVSKLSMSWA